MRAILKGREGEVRDKGIWGRSGGVRFRGLQDWRTGSPGVWRIGSHLMHMVECEASGETEGWDVWEEMEDVTS